MFFSVFSMFQEGTSQIACCEFWGVTPAVATSLRILYYIIMVHPSDMQISHEPELGGH